MDSILLEQINPADSFPLLVTLITNLQVPRGSLGGGGRN